MLKEIIVLGELHLDLYYESDFYELLVEKIVSRLVQFIKYNPDDLNRKILERVIKSGFSETPKKIIGHCCFKRGGNGNNSSEFLARLGVPTKLISIIGKGSEWMYKELKAIGINCDAVFQIDEITPVSTIIKSSFTTKIHLAPNLKNKMSFEGIIIDDITFENAKIIFSTPIAKKFIELYERASQFDLITAFNIETQKIQTLQQLTQLIKQRYDLFFLNLKDAFIILNNNQLSVVEVDEKFKPYAKIRVYTAGGQGSYIVTDYFKLQFPGIKVSEIVDRTGAGDCYAAGFLTKLHEIFKDKAEFNEFLKQENSDKLKLSLESCGNYATYSAIYKITKQQAPNRKELEQFINIWDFSNN
ncbi:MAG: carbohydrate kinase family protein [Promethearchaeota archaeon]